MPFSRISLATRLRRVDLHNQLQQLQVIMLTVAAPALAANPRAIVDAVGDQDPAQQLCSEAIAPRVDEREALTRRA